MPGEATAQEFVRHLIERGALEYFLADPELLDYMPERCENCGSGILPWLTFCAGCADPESFVPCEHDGLTYRWTSDVNGVKREHAACLECGAKLED